MRVLIVGAGIGGLALAGLLKQRGIKATIIERANNWKREGFSIGIWNNGLRVLQELKILDKFAKRGFILPNYTLSDGNGNIIKPYHFEAYMNNYRPPITQIVRLHLYNLLKSTTNGIQKKLGITIKLIKQTKKEVFVTFSNGKTTKYDVVVGADGINSQVRKLVFGNKDLHHLNWRGWFFWIDRRIIDKKIPKGDFEMCEPKQFFGLFPHGGKKVCAYLAMPFKPNEPDPLATRIKRFKEHFKDLKFIVPKIISSIKQSDKIIVADLAYVQMKKWYKKRVILIGDAAHAMEPFAGMGASMALEDALVLADELSEVDPDSIELAFERYTKRREKRIRLAEKQTRTIWKWTGIDSKIVNKIRNFILPLIPIKHFTKGFEELLIEPI